MSLSTPFIRRPVATSTRSVPGAVTWSTAAPPEPDTMNARGAPTSLSAARTPVRRIAGPSAPAGPASISWSHDVLSPKPWMAAGYSTEAYRVPSMSPAQSTSTSSAPRW